MAQLSLGHVKIDCVSQVPGSREVLEVAGDDARTDEALLAATAADPEAFGVFYRRHVRSVLAFHLNQTRRPDLAADLTAETFASALEGVARFRPELGNARGWMFTIAANKLRDSLRRGRVASDARSHLAIPPRMLTDDDLERSDEVLDAQLIAGDLARVLEGLPADQRAALLARVVDEREYQEIATQLACSESVVRQRVSRGLSVLRRELGGKAG